MWFDWGKPSDILRFEFPEGTVEAIQYHPWNPTVPGSPKSSRTCNTDQVLYHCKELNESFVSLDALVIAAIARRRLGQNQHTLVAGICRALEVPYLNDDAVGLRAELAHQREINGATFAHNAWLVEQVKSLTAALDAAEDLASEMATGHPERTQRVAAALDELNSAIDAARERMKG